jgi:hypothetical protein
MAERYSCAAAAAASASQQVPTTAVTASIAERSHHGVALSGRPATSAPRRVVMLIDTIAGSSTVTVLDRNADCAGCQGMLDQPVVVRTRNRWALAPEMNEVGHALGQVLRLSDPLLTGYECAQCGALPEAARYLDRRAADFDDSIATCPRCVQPAVRIEIRQRFELGELVERFGTRPVPAVRARRHWWAYGVLRFRGRLIAMSNDEPRGTHGRPDAARRIESRSGRHRCGHHPGRSGQLGVARRHRLHAGERDDRAGGNAW